MRGRKRRQMKALILMGTVEKTFDSANHEPPHPSYSCTDTHKKQKEGEREREIER